MTARADIAVTYAGLLGVDIVRSDLLETIAQNGDAITPVSIANALNEAKLVASIKTMRIPTPDLRPALVETTWGQILLVLDQTNDAFIVFDTTCKGNRAEVSVTDFPPR
ncbi:MAG: hypothetical protein KJP02_01895 [Octadecabacter sp.]|nr:hypothetical protein [Octadecabacter sp.]